MDNEELKAKYLALQPQYERLAKNLHDALAGFLSDKGIEYVDIPYRIKAIESFQDKIERKSCKEPFSDIKDICGVRVIHYYESDTQLIDEIIRSEFKVSETEDKTEHLHPDQFGYRSRHYVITVPKAWCSAPNYRGLEGLCAEIQVRTILMHAWAAINHKLSYKRAEDVPDEFKRSLFRLSALVELADQQFDILRAQREDYIGSLIKKKTRGQEVFDFSAPLNIDSLKALISIIGPERKDNALGLSDLVKELREEGIELKDIYNGYQKAKKFLPEIERDSFIACSQTYDPCKDGWNQAGFIRGILDVTSEKYRGKRAMGMPLGVRVSDQKWMKIIKDSEQGR